MKVDKIVELSRPLVSTRRDEQGVKEEGQIASISTHICILQDIVNSKDFQNYIFQVFFFSTGSLLSPSIFMSSNVNI